MDHASDIKQFSSLNIPQRRKLQLVLLCCDWLLLDRAGFELYFNVIYIEKSINLFD